MSFDEVWKLVSSRCYGCSMVITPFFIGTKGSPTTLARDIVSSSSGRVKSTLAKLLRYDLGGSIKPCMIFGDEESKVEYLNLS